MKRVATVALIAFAVTLALIIGQRMSTEAMAVVVGVACGVLASIPTSLLIVAVTGRQGRRNEQEMRQRRADYPPVVIVNPGSNQPRYVQPPFQAPPIQAQDRQFRVIGDEDALYCSVQDSVVLDEGRYF